MKKGFCWLVLPLFVMLNAAHAQSSKVTYIYSDPQGTPLAEADAQGNITARFDYMPYGKTVSGMSGAPDGPGYTGHVNDPDTGFVYMQARYYDPMGRMLSADPMGPMPGDVYSFNRYTYANNNPIRNVDRDGRQTIPLANEIGSDDPKRIDDALSARADFGISMLCGCDATYVAPSGSGAVQTVVTPLETSIGSAVAGRLVSRSAAVAAPEMAGAVKLAEPSSAQLKKIEGFSKKIPVNARGSEQIRSLPNGGVAVQATSPGRVPGSSAVYEKQIDSSATTIQYTKTTYDPSGNIVHVKDKISGETYP